MSNPSNVLERELEAATVRCSELTAERDAAQASASATAAQVRELEQRLAAAESRSEAHESEKKVRSRLSC